MRGFLVNLDYAGAPSVRVPLNYAAPISEDAGFLFFGKKYAAAS